MQILSFLLTACTHCQFAQPNSFRHNAQFTTTKSNESFSPHSQLLLLPRCIVTNGSRFLERTLPTSQLAPQVFLLLFFFLGYYHCYNYQQCFPQECIIFYFVYQHAGMDVAVSNVVSAVSIDICTLVVTAYQAYHLSMNSRS